MLPREAKIKAMKDLDYYPKDLPNPEQKIYNRLVRRKTKLELHKQLTEEEEPKDEGL